MILRQIQSLMLLAILHVALLPALPAFAAANAASPSVLVTAKANEALAKLKTFDDAVNFFYSHQLFSMGGAVSAFMERHGVAPQQAFPPFQVTGDRVEAPSLKGPILIKSTRPLVLRYQGNTWTPDTGKSLDENLDSLLGLLGSNKGTANGLLDGSWLIPSAHAYSKEEKLAIGVGAALALIIISSSIMSASANELVTYAAGLIMLGLGGAIAYAGAKSISDGILKIFSEAAAGNIPYLPSKVVSCSPGEIQFRRAEVGSADTFTMRVNTKSDGTPESVSFLDGSGKPLTGVGGPYHIAQRKLSPRSSNLRWIWSKEAEEEITAKLGLPKGVRIEAATLEDAVKKPENKAFAAKIGSGALFFDMWQRVCGAKSSEAIAKENTKLDLVWKNADKAKAKAASVNSVEEAPSEKESEGNVRKAE